MNKLSRKKPTIVIVTLLILLISYVAFFGIHTEKINLKGANEMRFGIDIRGGIDAAFVPKGLERMPTESELESARAIIETRLDYSGILDRDVTIDKEIGAVLVRFPWKADETNFEPDQAITELGSMAHLTFQDEEGNILVDGKNVKSATPGTDTQNQGYYAITLAFDAEGQAAFAEATGKQVGKSLYICLDGVPISWPTVQERIDSDSCLISHISTSEEAKNLSNQINGGALPFALIAENYSAISPTLGSNALDVMVKAGIIAFIIICLGLIIIYRLPGIIAVLSLLLQLAGQIILLTWPGITITLPGIAGIILSIGMGVDANVIAAERIKEEIKTGKSIPAAVASGFKASFSSIFDGNVTVLIAALVMMFFGSGAILSFAYTLLFGIIMNFIAGVTATKMMLLSIVQYKGMKKPEFFASKKFFDKTEEKIIPFYSKKKIYFTISSIIIVFGIIMTFVNGINLDIQFKGGSILKYKPTAIVAQEPVTGEESDEDYTANEDEAINASAEVVDLSEGSEEGPIEITINPEEAAEVLENFLENSFVSGQITTDYATGSQQLVLNISGGDIISNEKSAEITDMLKATYPEMDFELDGINNVTPYFSQKFLKNGLIAISLSALLIILYVWFSFRKIHGLSAGFMSLIALMHDLLVVFFTFIIFQIPLGDSFIAVALTVLGYSINDTIVIYDRIRENSRNAKKTDKIEDIVDKSISQSFTRSVNTNLAVFISVAIVYVFSLISHLDSISSFALPMAIGSISGCYSTVCITGPLWSMWQKRNKKAESK